MTHTRHNWEIGAVARRTKGYKKSPRSREVRTSGGSNLTLFFSRAKRAKLASQPHQHRGSRNQLFLWSLETTETHHKDAWRWGYADRAALFMGARNARNAPGRVGEKRGKVKEH